MKKQSLTKEKFEEKLNSLISTNKKFSLVQTEKEKTLVYDGTTFKCSVILTPMERIFTLEDAFKDQKKDLKAFLKKCKLNGDTEDEIAYKQLKVVYSAMNVGKKINYADRNQQKWWPWFVWDASKSAFVFSNTFCNYDRTSSNVGVRLCVLSDAEAKHVGKYFEAVFNKMLS